jgi:hypothetical protein
VKGSFKADFNVGEVMVESMQKVRIAAELAKSSNNLKQLGIAIHNYAATYNDELMISGTNAKGQPIKSLDEKPLLSWRVALLPYIEEAPLYQQFKQDEPWDSEHNKKLIAKMPKIFAPPKGVTAPEGKTYLQMVIGPKAMRPGFKIGTIPDGTSNTIAIVEAAEPVIWTKPDDVFIPGKEMPKDLKKKFGGHFKNGFNVAVFDGSVRWIDPKKVSDRTLWLAIQPDDGEPLGADW